MGLADPFPDEGTIMDKNNELLSKNQMSIEKLIYPKSRYSYNYSPARIYIPSRYVMIKIIKACIGCTTPRDLWLF